MPSTVSNDPREASTAESRESLAVMEAEAAEYFASRDAERTGAALNPVAPALEKATSAEKTTKKSAAAQPTSPKATTPAPVETGKVPGAPVLKPSATKTSPAATEPAKIATQEPEKGAQTPDFSDVSREYKPGYTRAPQWEKLHAKADHYEALATSVAAEKEALRTELEQLRAGGINGTPPPEITQRLTALQQERDDLQARLEAVAIEKSPRFEAQFKPRREAAIAQAKSAVGPSEAARIDSLLALPESSYRDEQVEALLATLPPLRATKLTQAVADLDRLAAERASLASQGSELWKQWTSEETAARERATQERNATAAKTFDAELKEWEVAGVTAQEAEAARSVYTGKGATLQDASRAALWGAVGPRVAQQLQTALSRVEELEAELGKIRAAQPGVGAGGSGALPSSNGEEEDDINTTSYADRIAKQALRAGVRFGV